MSCDDVLFRVTVIFFFQAEDGIRDLVRSRGLGDVYKRQVQIAADPFRKINDVVLAVYEQAGRPIALHELHVDLSLIHI